jgi:CrcB protein
MIMKAADLLWVGLGGAAGSMLRFSFQKWFNTSLPYGTFAVNLCGCFLIGILWGLLNRHQLSDTARVLLISGFCGGFTTFSAFTQESLQLLQDKQINLFFGYLVLSVAGGLLATFAGYKMIQ